MADIAHTLGYGQARILGQQLFDVFGVKPSLVREKFTPQMMTNVVLTWLEEVQMN